MPKFRRSAPADPAQFRYENTSFFPECLIGPVKWNMTESQVLDILEANDLVWHGPEGAWKGRFPTPFAWENGFVRKGKNDIFSLFSFNPEYKAHMPREEGSGRLLYEWNMVKLDAIRGAAQAA